MKQVRKKLIACILGVSMFTAIYSFAPMQVKAAEYIVTTSAKDGKGSLWQMILDAPSGAMIKFDDSISEIQLENELMINKNLVIDGGTNKDGTPKVTISSKNSDCRLFHYNNVGTGGLTIQGLIFKNGKANGNNGGGAIFSQYSNVLAINCIFASNQSRGDGGAVCVDGGNGSFTDCIFTENQSSWGGTVTADDVNLKNCSFSKNTARYGAAALGETVIAKNSTFLENQCTGTDYKTGVLDGYECVVLIHCTVVNNIGGSLYAEPHSAKGFEYEGRVCAHNSIILGNREANGQISIPIIPSWVEGKNLLDSESNSYEKVFGTREAINGYVYPLASTEKVSKLITYVTDGQTRLIHIDDLDKDQIGFVRKGNEVTYGAVELPGPLAGITIKKKPKKTVYYKGESIDLTGIAVQAFYNDGSDKQVTKCIALSKASQKGEMVIPIAYTENGVTKETSFNVTVKEISKPTGLKVNKLTSKGTVKVKISWKKIKGIAGFQVVQGKKTLKTVTKTSYTTGTLRKGKTFSYKVRAYVESNGKKVYGAYSVTKKIRT